ncbi:hypothetical protein K440DRAFT_596005 [Wilcoxina mikolae CBS 423.85]|nr:hypothetical protein K440DRAFT_596005 [Wilcoxina mikolae CBS 423.85]
MDYLKNLSGSSTKPTAEQEPQQQSSGGGIMDTVNTALGGGKKSEQKEDYLDKSIDFAQEKFLGAGPQDNESALEQAKDEQISDFIRGQYKSTTGKEFPVADK